MRFEAAWGDVFGRTTLLGSPFRPSYVDVPDSYVRQARKHAPDALAEARRRAEHHAQDGLVFIDDVLFQETRTPGFGVTDHGAVSVFLPDLTESPGITLIDPRYSEAQIEGAMARFECRRLVGSIQVIDPALLPDTVEADALGCFAVALCRDFAEYKFVQFKRDFATALLATVDEIESVVAAGADLAPCYAAIERIANWDAPSGRFLADRLPATLPSPQRFARNFLEARAALPPPTTEPPSPDDAEGIAQGFAP